MDVKEAVRTAKEYVAVLFQDENIRTSASKRLCLKKCHPSGRSLSVFLGPGI